MSAIFELINGPQDGADIVVYDVPTPQKVFVGRKSMGDGFAAWGKELCDRFPCQYNFDGMFYKYDRTLNKEEI
jgi:hypothetical protein